jgi:hypothetical protein
MIDEPVRVAHDSGFPPFAEVKDGKSEGLAVDIFRAAGSRALKDQHSKSRDGRLPAAWRLEL